MFNVDTAHPFILFHIRFARALQGFVEKLYEENEGCIAPIQKQLQRRALPSDRPAAAFSWDDRCNYSHCEPLRYPVTSKSKKLP